MGETTNTAARESAISTHTPGNWNYAPIYQMSVNTGGVLDVHVECGASHYVIKHSYRDEHDRRCTVFVGQANITVGRENEAEANARLIAAAPEMLEALQTAKACLERLDETEKSKTAYGDICLAIAKATGTASRADDPHRSAGRE